jgi:hypothetical protein
MHSIAQMLLAFCRWCDASFFGEGIRNSVWLFPFVEIFHLLALGLLGGTIILLNLSLLGVRFRGEPVSRLARDVQPLFNASLAVMLISGFLLFSTEALKMYGSPAFQFKMSCLALAIIFSYTLHFRIARDDGAFAPRWRRLAAIASFVLWAGVALGGRAIGYVNSTPPPGGGS